MKYDVIVIGGGMSGNVAAITAARRGLKCAVVEAESRVGRKILATGNGKCNLANTDPCPWEAFNAPDFVKPVLSKHGLDTQKKFWESVGIALREDEGRIYPHSLEASSVLNALRAETERLGVRVITDCVADSVLPGYKTAGLEGANVILASGSNATMGRNSCAAAKPLGHRCTPIYPSLAPLITDKGNLKGLKGVRVPVSAKAVSERGTLSECDGEIIFKDNGVSGTAAFGISTDLARLGYPECRLELDFAPDYTLEKLTEALKKIPPEGFVHKEIARNVRASAADAAGMARVIKRYVLAGVSSGSMSLAQAACGGLERAQFDPVTLQSLVSPGFFAAGEVLDVDGECGGFNLMWAAASGMTAGEHVFGRRR